MLLTIFLLFATLLALFGIGLVLWKRPSLLVLFYQRGPHINTWFVEDFVKTHTIRPCQVRRSGLARIKGPNWLNAGPLEGLKIGKGEGIVIQGNLVEKILLLFLSKSGGGNYVPQPPWLPSPPLGPSVPTALLTECWAFCWFSLG